MEERRFDFFTGCTADDPHKGVAAGFFAILLITLDSGLIHVKHLTFHKLLMYPVIHRYQLFLTATDRPVGHVVSGWYQSFSYLASCSVCLSMIWFLSASWASIFAIRARSFSSSSCSVIGIFSLFFCCPNYTIFQGIIPFFRR